MQPMLTGGGCNSTGDACLRARAFLYAARRTLGARRNRRSGRWAGSFSVCSSPSLLFFISIYNRLVGGRNAYKNAFAQIDVQLTRRHDLIPNLVETAKGYMKHERETLEAVIAARNSAVSGLKSAAAESGRSGRGPAACGRRERAERRARPAVRARRGVSGPEGEPEHDAAVRGADLDGEQGRVRPPGVQRRGDELQQRARECSRTASSPACSRSGRRSCSRSSRRRSAPCRR